MTRSRNLNNQSYGFRTEIPPNFEYLLKHGYLALSKYDDNKDNYITEEDKVFHQLRFWNDANSDGYSEKGELFTLEEMNVEFIDLGYDGSYQESDIYGNQILMKSVVKTKDGNLHLLFDLWFRLLDLNP